MDTAHVGSLIIRATVPLTRGRDGFLVVRLREELSAESLAEAWSTQVRARPELRLHLVDQGGGLRWTPLPPDAVELGLERGRAELEGPAGERERHGLDEDGACLPLRVHLEDPRTLRVRISHELASGRAALLWVEDLFGFLAAREGEAPPALPAPPTLPSRRGSALVGLPRALAWALAFRRRAGPRAGEETVDLSGGAAPEPASDGYALWRAILSPAESARIAAAGSVTAQLVAATAAGLLELQPERRRALIAVLVDLAPYRSRPKWSEPGNPTGGLPVQLFRGEDLLACATTGLAPLRRGVPWWTARLLDAPVRDERRLLAKFASSARTPLPERAPYENTSAWVSNFGAPRDLPRLRAAAEWMMPYTFAQGVFLTGNTLGDRTVLALCAQTDLFPEERVRALTGGLLGALGVREAETWEGRARP